MQTIDKDARRGRRPLPDCLRHISCWHPFDESATLKSDTLGFDSSLAKRASKPRLVESYSMVRFACDPVQLLCC